MAELSHRVLILSPYAPGSARGNASTARRTALRLEQCGAEVRIVESEAALVAAAIAEFQPEVLHGVHVGHTLRGLGGDPAALPSLPLVLTMGGNDLFEDLGVAPGNGVAGATKAGSISLIQQACAVLVATTSQQLRAESLRASPGSVFFAPRCPEIGREPIPGLTALLTEARQGQETEAYTIAWAGALRHQKRPEWIVPIHRKLRASFPNLVTVVAGPAPQDETETNIALALSQEPGIAVLKPFPGGGPGVGAAGTLLAATDVVLNTSRTEGKSNFILEAIAESTPVVAAKTPGNQDWLGGVAELFETEGEAVEMIAGLLRDKGKAEALATSALEALDLESAEQAEAEGIALAHQVALGGRPASS